MKNRNGDAYHFDDDEVEDGRSVRVPHPGIVLNQHYDGDGAIVFREACRLGCEASCRNDSARCIARDCHEYRVFA